MSVTIPDTVLRATRMTDAEFKEEIAVLLYARDKLTLAQAARLADMDQLDFQKSVTSRGFDMHYTEEDLEEDLRNVREFLQQ